MQTRFHIGKGRYESLTNSRYKDHTYGETSFANATIDLNAKGHGTYGALLFDKRWTIKRAEIILRDQNACIICKKLENLQVHHRQYHFIKGLKQFKAPWDYENHLMVTLCEKCHSKGHNKFRVPTVYL